MEEEIVISGISGRYPESANIDQFWNNLLSGKELYKESDARWPKGFMETPPRSGLLPTLKKFDAQFFGMSKSIANEMDPQFRMLHEVTFEALLDAGQDPFNLGHGQRTGMFIGYCENATAQAKAESALYDDIYGVIGDVTSVSQLFGFNGPVMTYDSACASSFSALNEAFHAIKCNIVDMAVVAGISINLRPRVATAFRRMGMTSPDGHCYCLDKRAKGYVRAETVSTIILQRKSVAKRCYAIVANVRSNADGYKVEGITFPGLKTQIKLMKETYQDANLDPKHVKYIEAHVTGTQAGDFVECGAIEEVFCPDDRTDAVLVGCLKASVGHSEGASGTVALSKACMIMQRKLIPSNINYKDPNPSISAIVSGKIKPVTELTTFDGGIISLDSFGFGGCNIHTILKTFDDQIDGHDNVHNLSGFRGINRLILFKARNESSFKHLKRMIEQKPDQITTEFLALVNNVAFLKESSEVSMYQCDPKEGDRDVKMVYRGYFILDGNDKTITECNWTRFDGCSQNAEELDHDNVMNQLATIESCGESVSSLFLNNTFLTKLGKCYMNSPRRESLINMDMMYPKVEYPVSRTTASISPLIEWNHGHDWKVYSIPRNFASAALKQLYTIDYGSLYSHLRGHVIDGRIIFPATQYLQCVWHVMAIEMIHLSADIFLKTGIKFWNVKFNQAIILNDRSQMVKAFVHANTITGHFEVVHEDTIIVTGHAQLTYDEPVPCQQLDRGHDDDDQKSTECLKRNDFYKELRIRGYDYCDLFQGVEECKIDGTGGKVSFLHNWVTFADAVLQLTLFSDPSRSLIVPTGIEHLQIDPSKFRHIPTIEKEHMFDIEKSIVLASESPDKMGNNQKGADGGHDDDLKARRMGKDEEEEEEEEEVKKEEYVPEVFNVSISKDTKEIFTNAGLYIKSMDGSPIVRKKASPNLYKHSFRPFDECFDHSVNHEVNDEYEKECLETLQNILQQKVGNGKEEMETKNKFEGDEKYSLLRKLKEYEKKKNVESDEDMNHVSLLEYLREEMDDKESVEKEGSESKCDLSMDTLIDVPLKSGECTLHQFGLVGESSGLLQNQIVEINTSSRLSLGHDFRNAAILLGPGFQHVYVDEQTVREKMNKNDDNNNDSSSELEKYFKGIINQMTKLVIIQHPSLGFTFMDTDMFMKDRMNGFKQGLKGVHDHASDGQFVMILFRTEPLDIESSILSAFKIKSNEDLIFEPVDAMKKLITSIGLTIISTKIIGSYVSILSRKIDCDTIKNVTKFEIDSLNYDWVDEINGQIYKIVPTDADVDGHDVQDVTDGSSKEEKVIDEKRPINDDPIFVISRGTGLTGINGFTRCVNREDKRIRGIHIETREGQTNYDDIVETCIKYNLLATYYRNGTFGSYFCDEGIKDGTDGIKVGDNSRRNSLQTIKRSELSQKVGEDFS